MDRNSTSPNVERNQVQRSVNLEYQNQPETPETRLRRVRSINTRFSQLGSSDAPSTSNTDHPIAASEREQLLQQDMQDSLQQQWEHNTHPEPPDSPTPQDQEYRHLEHEPGPYQEYLEKQRHDFYHQLQEQLDRQSQEQFDRHIEEQLDRDQLEYELMNNYQQYNDYQLKLQDSHE